MEKVEKKDKTPAVDTVVRADAEQVIKIPLKLLLPNPYQPPGRLNPTPEESAKLGADILAHGLHYAIKVRPSLSQPGKYEVPDGWQRVCAYRWLAADRTRTTFDDIPSAIGDYDDQDMADMVPSTAMVKPMTPIDWAHWYKQYLADFKVTQSELAKSRNVSQGEIANTIRLLDLPEDIQGKIITQEISETHGRQLLRLNVVPEMQQQLTKVAVDRHLSVNELDEEINHHLWDSTESLQQSNYGFDIKTCDTCPKRVMASRPWGNTKKEYRCPDRECWGKKQDTFEQARADKLREEGKKTPGKAKILTGKDIKYDQYVSLYEHSKKDLDNPQECDSCEKTALYKYDPIQSGEPERICLNPNCYRAKKSKKTREVHKVERQQDLELTAKIGQHIKNLTDGRVAAVIVAKDILDGFHNLDAESDMLSFFPDLPTDKKKRIENGALLKSLADRPLEDLLRICAAAVITRRRRPYAGYFSTKLDGEAKDYYDILCKSTPAAPAKPRATLYADGRTLHDVVRQDLFTPPLGLIPEGVRLARTVPIKECAGCNLDTKDHTLGNKFLVGDVSYKVCIKDYRAWEKKIPGACSKHSVDKTGPKSVSDESNSKPGLPEEMGLLDFQFRYCEGCHWADQPKVGTGKPCCTFITAPHIEDGKCLTRKLDKPSGTSDNTDPLAGLVIHTAVKDGDPHVFKLGTIEAQGKSLMACMQQLAAGLGWGENPEHILKSLRDLPVSSNRDTLIGIMEGRQAAMAGDLAGGGRTAS